MHVAQVAAQQYGVTCFPVSRHGFAESGVRCPYCNEMAAEPGDWRKVHKINKRGGIVEEGVSCEACGKFLLASPDDDIDPIKQGDAYDRSIYHKFARPPGWEPPRQQIIERPIRAQDWVVVWSDYVDERGHNLYNAEGMVTSVRSRTEEAVVVLAGFAGINGDASHVIPLHVLRPMAFERYLVGNRVRITRGERYGRVARIIATNGGMLTLSAETTSGTCESLELPMEHVTRIDLE